MKSLLVATMLAGMLLVCGPAAQAQVSVGIFIGAPPPPRVVRVLPSQPGPEFVWVQGYWYPVGRRYIWHEGYWTRPPYGGARWVMPRYDGHRYFVGYWNGPRGRVEHDHHWDHERGRDYDRWHGHDHGPDHGHGHDHEHGHDH
jgi:hypothetical protein